MQVWRFGGVGDRNQSSTKRKSDKGKEKRKREKEKEGERERETRSNNKLAKQCKAQRTPEKVLVDV